MSSANILYLDSHTRPAAESNASDEIGYGVGLPIDNTLKEKVLKKRSSGLVVIVLYKAITAALLVVISISLLLATKKQPQLLQFEDSLTLAGKRGMIVWVIEKLLNFNPKTLQVK